MPRKNGPICPSLLLTRITAMKVKPGLTCSHLSVVIFKIFTPQIVYLPFLRAETAVQFCPQVLHVNVWVSVTLGLFHAFGSFVLLFTCPSLYLDYTSLNVRELSSLHIGGQVLRISHRFKRGSRHTLQHRRDLRRETSDGRNSIPHFKTETFSATRDWGVSYLFDYSYTSLMIFLFYMKS